MSEFDALRKHEKTQYALYNLLGLGSATRVAAGFPRGNRPAFPMGKKSH